MFRNIPPVTKNLLIVNILFYVVSLFFAQTGTDLTHVLGAHYIGSIYFEPYQVITHMFMHDLSGIMHILFNMLLLYTKNIDLTISHCNKALYYYIEFIGQIADDSHSYLQLNSKDATLFIYKKTIFELNSEHRKNYTLSKEDKIFDNRLFKKK